VQRRLVGRGDGKVKERILGGWIKGPRGNLEEGKTLRDEENGIGQEEVTGSVRKYGRGGSKRKMNTEER